MKLYDYYRSSASYRVRIALQIKKIPYKTIPIHLLQDGGQHHSEAYAQINPQELVPTLDDGGQLITQSLAIIEYLEETYPHPALLPQCPIARSQVRQLAYTITCDIHPINNLRVLQQLRSQFKASEDDIQIWYHHWLELGFNALETHLQAIPREKPVCLGQEISLADICLIPQIYNAKRFNFALKSYPLLNQIYDYCQTLPDFIEAFPTI